MMDTTSDIAAGTSMKKLRKVSGDHDYDLSDSFSDGPKRITQSAYYRAGDFVIAIGELNKPNRWNDAAFEAAMAFLQKAWNDAVKAGSSPSQIGEG